MLLFHTLSANATRGYVIWQPWDDHADAYADWVERRERPLGAAQFRGGIIMGLGMALMEETQFDERSGRIMNPSLAEYHVPVQMDVPEIDVIWTDEPDPHTPMGARGVGEIGITGVGAAVATPCSTPPASACGTCPSPWTSSSDLQAGGRCVAATAAWPCRLRRPPPGRKLLTPRVDLTLCACFFLRRPENIMSPCLVVIEPTCRG